MVGNDFHWFNHENYINDNRKFPFKLNKFRSKFIISLNTNINDFGKVESKYYSTIKVRMEYIL